MQMKENRTKEFLITLLKLGGIVTVIILAPGAFGPIEKVFLKDKKFDKREFNRTVNRLVKIGVLETITIDGKITIRLSNKGQKQAVEYDLDDLEIKPLKKWDKKWRIVLFDIPENKKKARDAFKRRLNQLGFSLIQKSAYVLPYPCDAELKRLTSVYAIDQYVKLIVADYVEGQDSQIKNYYLVH